MPIQPPVLDDRSFNDLVDEIVARIPAHTPEWTNPREGDPGRTIIELFAWLTDTILYRANIIPEKQRRTFLRLLGMQMRSAIPARGLINVFHDDDERTTSATIEPYAMVAGPVSFETRTELTVLPITAEAYYKRPLCETERSELMDVVEGLQQLYQMAEGAVPYVTTPIFSAGLPEEDGFDILDRTVDKCLWLALLASDLELVDDVRESLGKSDSGGKQLINVGILPTIRVPALFEDIGPRDRIPAVWEISDLDSKGDIVYHPLDVIADSTAGFTKQGVQRLELPSSKFIHAPTNDVRDDINAGVGDRPPRLDDPKTANRLVAWLRLRPPIQGMALSWVGINAVEIDQLQTMRNRVIGQSNGSADQVMRLPGRSIETSTLEIEVEEPSRGYVKWALVDDLAIVGRDAAAFSLDSEAGVIRFGDGIRGRIPEVGMRVRFAMMRSGGGKSGNLPAGSLTGISARDLEGQLVNKLRIEHTIPTEGGEDIETLEAAERRIPATFRDHERAVTAQDYLRLATDTPGLHIGRVEVLPRFKPHQRRSGVPGVVSVIVLPHQEGLNPPNPRPDRFFLETVHSYLSERRPLGTELYVISCEYIPIGLSVGVDVADGLDREEILYGVRQALRRLLWPLPPYGPGDGGWPLRRPVRDGELEVAVARVPGVIAVRKINIFQQEGDDWRLIPRTSPHAPVEIPMRIWQLPELLSVLAVADQDPPEDLRGLPNPFANEAEIAVPVVPEVCR